MAMSSARADAALTADTQGAATPHVRLHVGAPGVDGTGNPALDPSDDPAVLKAASFAAISNHPTNDERRVLSDAAVTWSGAELKTGQEITHFSVWDASNPATADILYIAALTTPKTTGSDGGSFASGEIEIAIGVFQKP